MTERERLCLRFERAARSYHAAASAQRIIAERLARLLPASFGGSLLEIGCGTGFLTERLIEICRPKRLLLNDLSPAMLKRTATLLPDIPVRLFPGDAETLPFDGPFDGIASASALQWFREPERFFRRISRTLAPDGWLAVSSFTAENMPEIEALTGRSLSYPDLRTAAADSFEIIDYREEEIVLRFPNAAAVLRHLKETGVSGTETTRWTRRDLNSFTDRYEERFGSSEGVPLTFRPCYLIAKPRLDD